jgi:hypothetical protein
MSWLEILGWGCLAALVCAVVGWLVLNGSKGTRG